MVKNAFVTLVLALSPLTLAAQQWPEPKSEAKAGTRWWWLGSAVDEPGLKWNLGQYASHGIGAVEITPLYGVKGNDANNIPFLSDRWMQMLRYCIDEGRRNGIQVDMNCGTGWPFGGPDVPLSEAACKLVVADTLVAAADAERVQLQAPRREREYARKIVQRAFDTDRPDRKRVIALFESRTRQKVKRAAPGGEGWVIDHFDSTAVAHYLQRFDQAFERTGAPWPHTFFNDSYEVYGADWTPTLLDEFARRRGYRLEDHLPAFVDGDAQVVSHYRETLSDLLLHNFTEQWAAWAHRHGVKVRNQAHGSPANLIDLYAAVDIPEIEGFGLTDFGIKGLRTDPGKTRANYSDLSMLKYAPSAAHITGKPLTSSETFTWLTEHFRTSLSQMKPDLDLMFCAGVNHIYFHGSCYSPPTDPWPGWRFYASVDMSPTNSIWRDAPFLMQYVERCQSFLQWGEPDNDFLVFLPVRDMWQRDTRQRLMQFDIHSMARRAPEFIRTILDIDSLGFDCDYVSDRYLLGTRYDHGQWVTAAGTRYKALILPHGCSLTDAVRAHIEALEAQGARVIRHIDAEALQAAAAPELLKSVCGLNLIRRRNAKGYHYFIANLTPADVCRRVRLSVQMKDAMWFDPLTGERFAADANQQGILVPLRSGQSLILQTFSEPESECRQLAALPVDPQLATPPAALSIPIRTGWALQFAPDSWPAIDRTYRIDTLLTWELLDAQTRTQMGTGIYSSQFKLSAAQLKAPARWQIDLGDVRESARVYINNVEIGCAWAVPFVLNVPQQVLKKGRNSLRIEVTNLPANRIAELDRQHVPWRKFEEINVVDINYRATTYAAWEPVPSGLAGPVVLRRY